MGMTLASAVRSLLRGSTDEGLDTGSETLHKVWSHEIRRLELPFKLLQYSEEEEDGSILAVVDTGFFVRAKHLSLAISVCIGIDRSRMEEDYRTRDNDYHLANAFGYTTHICLLSSGLGKQSINNQGQSTQISADVMSFV